MNWEQLLLPQIEPGTGTELYRSQFERDFDRIVFSAPFRNLQDKTQVFPLPESDFVHTRLTHSLEVSSVGRSLGKSAGQFLIEKYPGLKKKGINPSDIGAIVAAAALAHDIGNPPFGHAGEEAISDFFRFHEYGKIWETHLDEASWADLVAFEGNAQGFRMLLAKENGLNISPAALAAFTKYPRPSFLEDKVAGRRSQKKYGFFSNDLSVFQDLAESLGIHSCTTNSWLRHPLAFLVEAADDICYSIIDLEDGCTLGLVPLDEVIDLFAEIIGDRFSPEKLNAYPSPRQKLAIMRAMAIGQLISETVTIFEREEENMLLGYFDSALTEMIPSAPILEKISTLSIEKIYRSKQVLEKEAAGFQVIEGLLACFSQALYHFHFQKDRLSGQDKSILLLLPEDFGFEKFSKPYPLLRTLLDFISGMTDKYALSLYRRVKGISLPGG